MVLKHISNNAIGIKVASAALCAEVFTEDDLDVPDELTAPQGLKNQICKSEHLQMSRRRLQQDLSVLKRNL